MTRRELANQASDMLDDTDVPTDWILGFYDGVFGDAEAYQYPDYLMGFHDGHAAVEAIEPATMLPQGGSDGP